jgi:hypothetical protein
MTKEITPDKYRCIIAECPALFKLEDGRTVVRAKILYMADEKEFDLPEPGVREMYFWLPEFLEVKEAENNDPTET